MNNDKIEVPNVLSFNWHFALAATIGAKCGVTNEELKSIEPQLVSAQAAIEKIRTTHKAEAHTEDVRFMSLPYQFEADNSVLQKIQHTAKDIQTNYEDVIAIGIGGSYLGIKVLFEALAHPRHNDLPRAERRAPRLWFSGENLEPEALVALAQVIDLKKTKIIITSKSGGTTEPSAALMWWQAQLLEAGGDPTKQIIAITDPTGGALKRVAEKHHWETFAVPSGIGGRWTVLAESTLLFAAILNIDILALLRGAKIMDQTSYTVENNPALKYAAICYLGQKYHDLNIGVIMPYSSRLKALAEWFVQLLAESLGKAKNRRGEKVNVGRTPLVAVGTTDMHSQTQQHREGRYDKFVTIIEIAAGSIKLSVPDLYHDEPAMHQFANHDFRSLLNAALSANEKALADDGRPSCRLTLPNLEAETLGGLLYFFELATVYEAELLNVNAFDQPGVEAYKKYLQQYVAKQ